MVGAPGKVGHELKTTPCGDMATASREPSKTHISSSRIFRASSFHNHCY
jgi:hypothetical protein